MRCQFESVMAGQFSHFSPQTGRSLKCQNPKGFCESVTRAEITELISNLAEGAKLKSNGH